jgi:predicted RNA binding protein YcfA (HicA-like mRNA interferase family)
VKRRALIKKLTDSGCVLLRNGAKHDWYQNPITHTSQAVPRHTEIADTLAKQIIKTLTGPGI